MSIGTLIDSIFLSVYGGNPSDDVALSREQVQFWLLQNRDMLVKAACDLQIKNGKPIDTVYVERETNEPTDIEDLPDWDEEDDRIFFTLTKRPMSLLKDQGVLKVITNEGLTVYKTTLERVETISDLKYAKPSPTNLVYYRTQQDINVLGLSPKNLTTTTFTTFYIPSLANQTLTEADDIKLQDDLAPVLLQAVEDIARRELFGIQDTDNDGVSPDPQHSQQDWRITNPQE